MKYLLSLVFIGSIYTFALSKPAEEEATAPKKGIIKGKVFDEFGKPMEYANIIIYNQDDSSLVNGTISNADGSFMVGGLHEGKYYLIANFIGYNKKIVPSISISHNHHFYDAGFINLSVSKTEIEGVEIVADRARVEYKIDKKVVNVSQDVTASGGSAVDVLANTPSVSVDVEGNVQLRGSSSFTVLIDGRPTVLTGSDALEQIPASTIENIEIITNPSAKYDPDGTAGIINVVLKKGALQGISGMVNSSIGTGNKYKADALLSYKTDKINAFGSFYFQDESFSGTRNFYKESYNNRIDSILYYESSSERIHSRNGLNGKAGIDFYLSKSTTLSLSGTLGNSGFGGSDNSRVRVWNLPFKSDTLQALYDSLTLNTSESERNSNFYDINLNFIHKFDEHGHEISASVQQRKREGGDHEDQEYQLTDENWNPLDVLPEIIQTAEDGTNQQIRFNVDYTKPFHEKSKLEAGYQAWIDNDSEEYSFSLFDNISQEWVKNNNYSSKLIYNRQIHSAYSTYSNQAFEIDYQLGLRIEYTYRKIDFTQTDSTQTFIIDRPDFFPTLHLSKELGNGNQVMASYSRRINRPRGWQLEPYLNFVDKYSARMGNPGLQPEYINSYELGYQKKMGMSFIAVEGFYRVTQNKITRYQYNDENDKNIMSFANLNKDHSLGAEIMANLEPARWYKLNASTNLYHYRIEGSLKDEDVANKSFNWDGRINNTFIITPLTRVQLNGFYRGPTATAQGERKGFFGSDIAVKQDFFKRSLSLTLQVRDIFGTMKFEHVNNTADLYSHGQFKREPRIIMLTLSYKINNYNKKQAKENNQTENGNDFEGGDF
ncbi:MAG: TonB-dependent receptor [Bacteroidales bacterium]|nr:TonB-dependent receptor [Bacteroidales bacterium]